jgi:small subunit ribosomal protein S1
MVMIEETGSNNDKAAVPSNEGGNNESMENFLEKYSVGALHRGKTVEGTVVASNDEGWLVDVGFKCEGFLPRNEWSHRSLVEARETPSLGDAVRVRVVSLKQGEEAQLIVSRWRTEFDERWDAIEASLAAQDVLEVRGLRKVKGGLIVDCLGIEGFVPVSHLAEEGRGVNPSKDVLEVRGLRKVKGGLIVDCLGIEGFVPVSHLAEEGRGVNPSKLVDDTFNVKVLEKDRRKRRIVLSRRALLEEELQEERQAFFEKTEVGQTMEGTVTSITSFGAFVNLGPVEGLVHNTELAWGRNIKPKEIVNKGDRVMVMIIGLDPENSRVSLSIKQTQPDPWDDVAGRYEEGQVLTGKVTNLADFGAFVEIEPGVEGLVHIGDISWQRIRHPREVLKKGQKVETQILAVDGENRRISLGYKQLHDPWKDLEEKYQVDGVYPVKVVRLTDFGAFVELEEGIEGLIHVSQISRKRVERPGDVLSEGQEVQARIIEIKTGARRIRLSMSSLEEPVPQEEREPVKRRKRGEQRNDPSQFIDGETNVTIGDILKESLEE